MLTDLIDKNITFKTVNGSIRRGRVRSVQDGWLTVTTLKTSLEEVQTLLVNAAHIAEITL